MKATHFPSIVLLALSAILAGCSAPGLGSLAQGAARGGSTSTTGGTPAVQTAGAQTGNPDQAAVQIVVQKANEAQQQAFEQRDPALMQDTATSGYYQEITQTNSDLQDAGVTEIKLLKLEWGPISVNRSQAQVTTFETWSSMYSDGSTDQARERNIYTLVQRNGKWKVEADEHPDSGLDQPGAGSTTPGTSRQPGSPPARVTPARPGESHNWSGYAATGGNYTAVNGSWNVPQEATASGSIASDATWVGIGGVRSGDLIQAGTEETATSSGRVRYQAWVETLPQASHPVPLQIHPGDSVSVSISDQGANNWLISFKNNTTGRDYQTSVQYTSSHNSAEWVEEAPSAGRRGVLPLTNFNTVQFTDGSAVKDGRTVNIAGAGAKPITMIGAAGQQLAVPSSINADGASFSVNRTQADSSSAPAAPGQLFPIGPGDGSPAPFGSAPGRTRRGF